VAQLVLSTIYLVGLSLVAPALWIVASLALYIVIAACWLPVVVLQIRMRGRRGQGVGLTAALPPPVASLVLARLAGLLVDAGHFLADGRQARLSGHKKSPTCHTGEPGSEKRKLTVKPLGY
jgi:Predicted integral membrane protein (DUF2269)